MSVESLYSRRSNLIIAFHGCDQSRPYDSVRGVFWEGHEIYPNAGFSEKNHIQICVCNPNCIKGYFLPRKLNNTFTNP